MCRKVAKRCALIPLTLRPPLCRKLLDAAVCCALDAEWPPEETEAEQAHRGGPPHATLVQLALWLPPGGTGANGASRTACGSTCRAGGGSDRCCVLLLDMIRLPQAGAKQALQSVLRCERPTWLLPVLFRPEPRTVAAVSCAEAILTDVLRRCNGPSSPYPPLPPRPEVPAATRHA